FPALVDLLATGATSRLSKQPPTRRDAQSDVLDVRPHRLAMVPDEEDLVAAALGCEGRRLEALTAPSVNVRVVHGNLARALYPVLVGHYRDDVFVSAESYLDGQLDGRLRELHRLDVYPGAIGTTVVVANKSGFGVHPGAIVVGLGAVGELTPGLLMSTIEN